MAQFELHGFDDLMMQLDRLGRTDEVAPKMLEEAVPILQEEVVSQAEKHRDTGEMAASIKPTKVTKSADGYRGCPADRESIRKKRSEYGKAGVPGIWCPGKTGDSGSDNRCVKCKTGCDSENAGSIYEEMSL